jgi:hypothetical protein
MNHTVCVDSMQDNTVHRTVSCCNVDAELSLCTLDRACMLLEYVYTVLGLDAHYSNMVQR